MAIIDLSPTYNYIPSKDKIISEVASGEMAQKMGGLTVDAQQLSNGGIQIQGVAERILIGSATEPMTGVGIFIGNDGALLTGYDFRVGDPSGNYLYWDASAATLTVSGVLTASSLHIPNQTTVNSFHTDSNGNSWWGTNVATGYATAPASILNTGFATFANVAITGGTCATSVLDKGVMAWTTTLVFSATDADTVAWTTGAIKMQDGTTYTIDAGNTGNMSALTYIYLDIAVSLTVLQVTTTYSTAVGNGKILICTALNQASGYATYIPRGGQAPAIATSQINSGSFPSSVMVLSSRGWTQTSVFSSTDLNTVSWGTGTFTSADGTAYSISAGNTGNMAAKTYIYLDTAVSTTVYQTTTTPTTAIGDNKVLVAVAQNTATEASFEVLGGAGGKNIDAANIVAGTITGNEIAATTVAAANIVAGTITTTQIASSTIVAGNIATGTITADRMSVSQLSAIAADLGTITAGSINVNSGQALISSNGDATFKSIQVGGSSRQYTLTDSGIFSFGDGSDGDATCDGSTAVTGMTRSGSTYTTTRDVYFQNLTINLGKTLKPNGYRIFVQDTLTVNGTIERNGNSGTNGTSNTGQVAGSTGGLAGGALADGYLKGSLVGQIGQTGGDQNQAGTNGMNGNNTTNSLGLNGSGGGKGGDSGSGFRAGGTASSGGTITASNVKLIANWHLSTLLDISSTGASVKFDNSASTGGGAGGGGGSSGGGGGGGSGSAGGIIAIYVKKIIINSTGSITANGGAGGNGGDGCSSSTPLNICSGGGGGGGGGNGGLIILVYNSLTNGGSITATAGAKGNKGLGGVGTGGATSGQNGDGGTIGSAGVIYQFLLSL